jgi:hypothetical protein
MPAFVYLELERDRCARMIRACFKNDRHASFTVPQGLKPLALPAFVGTTEVVP